MQRKIFPPKKKTEKMNLSYFDQREHRDRRKVRFYPIFLVNLLDANFAPTLVSSNIKTTDVLRPLFTRSGLTTTLKTVHCVQFFPSLNEGQMMSAELRQITSGSQFGTP